MSKQKCEYFPVATVSRHDLTAAGYDATQVDEVEMGRLADKMADAYLAGAFWGDLRKAARAIGIPKRGEE